MGANKERWAALAAALSHLPQRSAVLYDRFAHGNAAISAWQTQMLHLGRRPVFIVMIERLGDLIACSPIAKQLKVRDPSLAIAWVCSKKYSDVFIGNKYIDVVFNEESLTGWLLSKRHLTQPAECHELFLDTQRCCWTGLRLPGRHSGITHNNYLDEGRNLLLSYSQAAGIHGIRNIEPDLYLSGSEITAPKIEPNKFVLAIHFDSEDPDRRLSSEAASAFAERALSKGWTVVELGLRPIASKENHAIHFPGRTLPLRDHMLLIKSAHHFAGVDSSFLHCANAFRTPSTLFLGKFRHFKSFQTFSGEFLLSERCKILRTEMRAADFPPALIESLVPDIEKETVHGDIHAYV